MKLELFYWEEKEYSEINNELLNSLLSFNENYMS